MTTSPTVLQSHGRDENFPEVRPPLAVAYAEQVEDVQTVLGWCRAHHIALIPFGAGTSLEGALVPADPQVPTISLDLSRMNKVLSIQPENFLAVVQPGVTRTALNTALRYSGLFFPVDPGADASLGGMAATNASGTTTVRYGGMRPNTLALQVVLANGECPAPGAARAQDQQRLRPQGSVHRLVGHTGGDHRVDGAPASAARAYPHPARLLPVDHRRRGSRYAVMASALPVARLELVDELSMRSVNRYLGRSYPEAPGLFLEFHSSTAAAMETEVALVEG